MSVNAGEFSSDDIVNELSGTDDGQGPENEVQPETPTNEAPIVPEAAENQQPQFKDNPAWDPYLQKLQDVDPEIQSKVKEILYDIDLQTQRRFERVSQLEKNFGPFAQQNIDPQILNAGLQLFQNLNADPQAFYQKLGESLGITAEEAEDLVESGEDNPQIARMQQEVEQMRGYLAQQQQAAEEQKWQQEVAEEESKLAQDIQTIRERYNLSDAEIRGAMERTVALMQTQPAATIFDGLQALLNERAAWERSRPLNNAPSTLSGNGTSVQPPDTKFEDVDEKQQRDILANLIAGL